MAEATAHLVSRRLSIDAACPTADRAFPDADDPDALDELVVRYGGANPTDESVVAAGRNGRR